MPGEADAGLGEEGGREDVIPARSLSEIDFTVRRINDLQTQPCR